MFKQLTKLQFDIDYYENKAEEALGYWADEALCTKYNQLADRARVKLQRLCKQLSMNARFN